MMRHRWSPYRWHRHGPLRLALVTATLASLSISVLVVPPQPAGAIPQGSSPDLYVTGSEQASVFSFSGNSLGAGTPSQPGPGLKAVVDTSDGARTVTIGRTSHTPRAFVLDPASGTKVGSIAFPGLPLVGVAADPRDPNLVFVASENALYSADVQTLLSHNVYTLPSTAKATFATLAISPNGARAYLGGENSSSGSPVNAIFTVKLTGAPTTSEWVAPTNNRYFTGAVTDLALTPNGKELYATNSSSLSSTVAPTTTTSAASVPTMLTVTGFAPNLNEIQWHWTAKDNGSPITDWALALSLNGVVTTQVKIPGPASYTSAVGCGGGTWTLQVSAINSVGQSAPLTSNPVAIQPNCSTQPTTTPSTAPTTTPTTTASSGSTGSTGSTQGSTTQSSTTGCNLLVCRTGITICPACLITTTTEPIIQGPESPPVAPTVTQSPPNVPSARILIDAVAFGFPVPFHSPHPPTVVRPLPPPGTLPSVIVPLPYPSVPAARAITVSPDGLDVYVASSAGFNRTIPYLTGFPVAQPQQHKSVPLATTNAGIEPSYRADDSIAITPDGRALVAAVAGQDDTETDLDVVAITSDATAPPSMVAPASPSRTLHFGWPTGPKGIAITPDQSPVPRFSAAAGQVGTATTFDASASTVQFGTIASYNWSFGDGKSGTGQNASHVYTSTGTYSVQLCETDSTGVSTGATVPGTSFRVDTPGQTPYWNSSPCVSHSITVPGHLTTATTPTTVTTATTPTTAKVTTTSGTTTTTTTVTTKGTTTTTTRPTTTATSGPISTATTGAKTTSTHGTVKTGTATTATATTRTRTTARSTTTTATTSPVRTGTTAATGVTTTVTTGTARTATTTATTAVRSTGTTGTKRTTTTTAAPAHHSRAPALELDPPLGPPGTLVAVTGHGFPKDRLVTISWSISTGSVVTRTNSRGQLKATLMILVPDVLGPRDATAKGFRASARFLVVPGSGQPGGNDPDPIYRTESP
jgi:PKD domain